MRPNRLMTRILWFVGLWTAGVLALAAVAFAIRLVIAP